MISSDGALELHPSLGIADIIVDLTSSGITLKDNRLRELSGGRILESAACLIGHTPSLKQLAAEGAAAPLALLLDSIDGVRLAQGRLQFEITGGFPPELIKTSSHIDQIFNVLSANGASRMVWQEVQQADSGNTGWQIRGLVGTRGLNACRRSLIDLGAISIVGTRPEICLDRDDHSTFESLKLQLH